MGQVSHSFHLTKEKPPSSSFGVYSPTQSKHVHFHFTVFIVLALTATNTDRSSILFLFQRTFLPSSSDNKCKTVFHTELHFSLWDDPPNRGFSMDALCMTVPSKRDGEPPVTGAVHCVSTVRFARHAPRKNRQHQPATAVAQKCFCIQSFIRQIPPPESILYDLGHSLRGSASQ